MKHQRPPASLLTFSILLMTGMVLTGCEKGLENFKNPFADESSSQTADPIYAEPNAQESSVNPSVEQESGENENLLAEVDSLHVELKRLEEKVLSIKDKMQTLHADLADKEQQLAGRQAQLMNRETDLNSWESALNEREKYLNLLKYGGFAALAIAVILFLAGYISLRVGKKRMQKAKAEREQLAAESTSPASAEDAPGGSSTGV